VLLYTRYLKRNLRLAEVNRQLRDVTKQLDCAIVEQRLMVNVSVLQHVETDCLQNDACKLQHDELEAELSKTKLELNELKLAMTDMQRDNERSQRDMVILQSAGGISETVSVFTERPT